MMQPIQFQKGERISLNRLRLEIDRRVSLITMMVKGMKPNQAEKVCAQKCCQISHQYSQTDQLYQQPLTELPQLSLSNTPSVKSIKSPTNLKRESSTKNKENQFFHQSASSIASKNKPLLISIEESEQQGLKTSRYLKNLESQKKKVKPPPLNMPTLKKSQKTSNFGSNIDKKAKNINQIHTSTKQPKQDSSYVVNSFDSNRKKNFTERKSFKNSTNGKLMKQPTTEEKVMNFSFNSSILDMSESKSRIGTRKSSINMNNDSFLGSSSNNISKKHGIQSFSTNNVSSAFTTEDQNDEHHSSRVKRMTVGEEVKLRVESEFANRMEQAKKKSAREPKTSNNNIRVSLLKRLEDKHIKAQEVTK